MAFPQIVGQPGVSAFLQSILRDLDAAIKMSDSLFLVVNRELKEIKELLFGFQDVLVDGEKRRYYETSVEKWMDELKDLLYDTDDLLDEIRMEKQMLERDVGGQTSNGGQVCFNFSDSRNRTINMKNMLGVVLDRLDKLVQEIDHLKLKRGVDQHNASWVASQAMVRPRTGSFAVESEIHGREEDKNNIIQILLAEGGGRSKMNYEVVCLLGMGGLGKTTLAQLVFHDENVDNFFPVKSWACVSDVFDVIKVTKDLIESAEKGGDKSRMPSSLPALQDRLKKIINGKKFLLVLDDIWAAAKEWDNLKASLNFGAKGSKILVTSRLKNVVETMSPNTPYQYQLGPLEDEECLAVFNDNAFGDIDGSDEDAELMKMGKEIVKKCGGVPLVAKLIGAMLRGKGEGEWKVVKENDLWNLVYEDKDLHPGIRLSYFYLPPFLKRCFEYIAVFPSDFKFEEDDLVRMWMAEGLIEVKEGMEPEEIGRQYYKDLKERSLVQENDMMHDMVHHLACIVSGSFCFQRNSGASSSRSSLQSVRHAYVKHKSELPIDDADKLRTLIHEGDFCQELFSHKRSRVLKLRPLSDPPAPISIIGQDLKHLRYLNVSSFIVKSPLLDFDSICTLTNLQVLDLSHSYYLENLPLDVGKLSNLRCLQLKCTGITSLPDSVCSLSNLQVLDLFHCECLRYLPIGMGKLSNLRFLQVGKTPVTRLPEFGYHSSLRFLGLEGTAISSLPDSVCSLPNLRVLDLSYCRRLTDLPIDIGNLQRLCELKIDTEVRLPESVVNATNLRVLDVSITNQPAHIGKLTKLEKLDKFRIGEEEGHGIIELKDMNRLKGNLTIENMENIKNVEEALMADLKSKKHIETLNFLWEESRAPFTGRDGEMEVRVMEALEPNAAALKSLSFHYYVGHKFPGWLSTERFHNLTEFIVLNLPMVTKMVGIVFQSLKILIFANCPALMEVSVTAPKLEELKVVECKGLKEAAQLVVHGLMDALEILACEFCHLDHFLQRRKATNASPCTKLQQLTVFVGVDSGIASLPISWPNILTSLIKLKLEDLPPTNFKIVSDEDQSCCVSPSIMDLTISDCPGLVSLQSLDLPPSLKRFEISDCPNLRDLPCELRNLTSLRTIEIRNCPNLEISSVTDISSHNFFPSSLAWKHIMNCPKLEEQLKKDNIGAWERDQFKSAVSIMKSLRRNSKAAKRFPKD